VTLALRRRIGALEVTLDGLEPEPSVPPHPLPDVAESAPEAIAVALGTALLDAHPDDLEVLRGRGQPAPCPACDATINAARTLADPSGELRPNPLDAYIEGEGPWVDELLRWLDHDGALIDRAIWSADQALDTRDRYRTRNGPQAVPPWVTLPD
jgi:hypothetical protein